MSLLESSLWYNLSLAIPSQKKKKVKICYMGCIIFFKITHHHFLSPHPISILKALLLTTITSCFAFLTV